MFENVKKKLKVKINVTFNVYLFVLFDTKATDPKYNTQFAIAASQLADKFILLP